MAIKERGMRLGEQIDLLMELRQGFPEEVGTDLRAEEA